MRCKNSRSAWLVAQRNAPQERCTEALRACDAGSLHNLRDCNPSNFTGAHLRLLAMRKHTSATVVKFMVNEVGLQPSDALDVALGPRMVRILLALGADPSRFSYFDSDFFLQMSCMRVADDSDTAENFRRTVNLYPAMGIRVLKGAKLPRRVEEWFDAVSTRMLGVFLRDHGSEHMRSCHQTFQRQFQAENDAKIAKREVREAVRLAAASTSDEGSTTETDYSSGDPQPSSAGFLAAYVNYVRFLPIKLFVSSFQVESRPMEKSVEMMLTGGLNTRDVDMFRQGVLVKTKRDSTVRSVVQKNDLYFLVQRVVDIHEDGIRKNVLGYL